MAEPNEGQETPGDLRSKLEAALAREKALQDQVQGLAGVQLENAAYKADLKLSDKQLRALFAVHEGDDFGAEALKATAEGLGFTAPATTPDATEATPPPPPSAHSRIDAAASGSSTSGEKSWDEKFAEARQQGREATEQVVTEYQASKRGMAP